MWLMTHYFLLRGESVRRAYLADMFSLKFPRQQFTDGYVLVLFLRQGKTNRVGKREFCGAIRATDPLN